MTDTEILDAIENWATEYTERIPRYERPTKHYDDAIDEVLAFIADRVYEGADGPDEEIDPQ